MSKHNDDDWENFNPIKTLFGWFKAFFDTVKFLFDVVKFFLPKR